MPASSNEPVVAPSDASTHTAPGNALLFGIWGPSENDLFAVGDNKDVDNPAAVVWRFDGKAWTVVDLTTMLPGVVPPLNKVWGPNGNEIYAVGQQGTIIG